MNKIVIKILGHPELFDLKHQISNAVILLGVILGFQSAVFNYSLGLPDITVYATGITSVVLAVMYYLSRVKGLFLVPVYISLFVSLCVYTPIMWFGNGGSIGGFQYYIFLYLAFAIATIQKQSVLLFITIFVIVLSYLLFFFEFKFPEDVNRYANENARFSDISFSYISVLAGIAALFFVYTKQYNKTNNALKEQNIKSEKQKELLKLQHFHIFESLTYARKIQRAVLPSINIIKEHTKDHFIIYLPKEKVSGDFYYFMKKNDMLIVAVADSTGHGIPGGFMSMLGITILEEVINRESTRNAAEILNAFRERIITSLEQGSSRTITYDGFDISLCIINTKTKRLNYAGANLPLLIIRNKEFKYYSPDNMPIGTFISMSDFNNQYFDLKENDLIYMFTDGLIDQFGGPNNKKFTLNKLQEILLINTNKKLSVQKEQIKKEFRNWRGKQKKTDDVLIIGLKVFSMNR